MPSPRRLRRKTTATAKPVTTTRGYPPLWWMPVTAVAIVIIVAVALKQESGQLDQSRSSPQAQARGAPDHNPSEFTISGIASVTDGDSITVAGSRVRLFGIDAPEGNQACRLNNQPWACGAVSSAQLRKLIGDATVRCRPIERDRYGRIVARCYVRDTDIQSWMVVHGWAVAYSRYSGRYEPEQRHAQERRLGIWQGDFDLPEDWRRTSGRR